MWEVVLNVGAVLGLLSVGYGYMRNKEDKKEILLQRKELDESIVYSPLLKNEKIDFDLIKKANTKMQVALVVPSQDVYTIPRNTLVRHYHDFKISKHEGEYFEPFIQNFMVRETGGQFGIRFQDYKINVDIRECNIHRQLMQKSNESIKIDGFDTGTPIYESISFFLKTGFSMVIVGSLQYNVQRKEFLLIPSFLLRYSTQMLNRSSLLASAYQLLETQVSSIYSQQFIYLIVTSLILYSRWGVIKRGYQSAKRWLRQLFMRREDGEFENLTEVTARLSDKLLCPCGRTLSIIYPCGHLSSCEECVAGECRLCGREGPGQRVFT